MIPAVTEMANDMLVVNSLHQQDARVGFSGHGYLTSIC